MIVKSVRVKSFRSIKDETLELGALTALVGRNGAGKSSFLAALEMFYRPALKVSEDDYYSCDTSQDIEIEVTFGELSAEERNLFARHVCHDLLAVTRVFHWADGAAAGKYHGAQMQNADFAETRRIESARDRIASYNSILRARSEYEGLPTARSAGQVEEALVAWEMQNPERCTRLRDSGQFFGFTGVAQGYLGRHTQYIRVPAVRDAAEDASEHKGTCINELMDLVVRSVLASRQEVQDFRQNTQAGYQALMDPSRLPELGGLRNQLSATLKSFVPDGDLGLDWAPLTAITIPLPQADVKLIEDDYESPVNRVGHGLQRALIMTLLQHLVAARQVEPRSATRTHSQETESQGDSAPGNGFLPSLLLAIEEPELYQHPCRQRHIASVLDALSEERVPGVVSRTQVLYSTHSPLFLSMDRFAQVRLLTKCAGEQGKPKQTRVHRTTIAAVASELSALDDRGVHAYTPESVQARLQASITPRTNEGFFADLVVLVEGEGDCSILQAQAKADDVALEAAGICLLPCMGKDNMCRLACIFRQLGIPIYLVWDNDQYVENPNPRENRRLLRFLGQAETDWPSGVTDRYACCDGNLEHVLKNEFAPQLFDSVMDRFRREYSMKWDQAIKNPFVLQRILSEARDQGSQSPTVRDIVLRIGEVARGARL